MQYFDEAFPDNCGSCDICLGEIKKFDGTLIAQKALSAVARLKEGFGNAYVIDFLRGAKREKIREAHKQLKTFGVGAEIQRDDWFRYIRELVTQGYLRVSDDVYPVLKLTGSSDDVLKGLRKVELMAPQTFEEKPNQEPAFETGLLSELKLIRREIATNENVPAYIILSDASLVEMATYLPQNLDELRLIAGFGDVKLARYGREFLEPVKNYCLKYGLRSRVSEKTHVPKRKPKNDRANRITGSSDTRAKSFTLYRSGKSIAAIAAERGLAVTTIENHLSYFVQTGEMDLRDIVGEEKIGFIKDAIESYGYEKLSPLKEVLGENYSYGEIKAVIGWINKQG
jgi:ATP-dependent DNA helicase RecQ